MEYVGYPFQNDIFFWLLSYNKKKVPRPFHEKLLFMIKTDNKPYTRFTMNNGNTVNLMDNLNENKT